jgi:hypothetical protein
MTSSHRPNHHFIVVDESDTEDEDELENEPLNTPLVSNNELDDQPLSENESEYHDSDSESEEEYNFEQEQQEQYDSDSDTNILEDSDIES